MSPVIQNALIVITDRVNLSSGLSHANDKNSTKELLLLLHEAGEVLDAGEIFDWACDNGWRPRDARELSALAARIGSGHSSRIEGGPWWADGILDILRGGEACNVDCR